ncbi:ABC transporter ATP-binding protein [Anaerosporobacter faecicola]|uniref:ABC transporter ATP-binding protein n=1 Tax=Anaerosporobacter faecicola TaxID=2718714 RepID=UPI00143BDC31|nr:ABC transporter ATP-binding protein [Anaerosporobacter faecicola]
MTYDIKIEQFSFAYHKNNYILKDINLNILSGSCIGLVGSNGSGKTTLIKCILGELSGNGLISILGETPDITSIPFKKKLGIVMDDDLLLDYLTLNEYLHIIGKLYGILDENLNELITYWLNYFNLIEFQYRIIKFFSHGMRKKVQIIGAIIHKPAVLIIDEPTNGLDIEMIYLLKKAILELKKNGTTIIVSTHILSFVEDVCDEVAILSKHSIQLQKSIEYIKKNSSLEDTFLKLIQ